MSLPQYATVSELRLCKTCEYFDTGEGIGADGYQRGEHGDCHNRESPHFQTASHNVCSKWVKST